MTDNLIEAPSKLFLLKKEKLWGFLGAIFGLGTIGLILKAMLPYIIKLFQSLLQAFAYGTAMAIMGVAFFIVCIFCFIILKNSGKIFTIFSKKISKAIIRMGPIELMKGFAEEFLDEKLEESAKGLSDLNGATREQDESIKELQEKADENQEIATTLSNSVGEKLDNLEDGEYQQYELASRGYEQCAESIKRLGASRDVLTDLYETLKSLHDTLQFNADYIRQAVKIKEIEYRAMQAGDRSARAAARILIAGKELRDYNTAAEVVREDISRMAGNIDTTLNLTKRFVALDSIQRSVATEKMKQRIQNLRANAAQMATNAQERLEHARSSQDISQIAERAVTERKPIIPQNRFQLRRRKEQ